MSKFVSQRPVGSAPRDTIMTETAVIGVYASPESLERAGDALVNSGGFSDSDICLLLPQELEGDAKMGAFLLSVSCSTSQS